MMAGETVLGFMWLIFICGEEYFIKIIEPMFICGNAHKENPRNSFYLYRQQGYLLHF